MICWVGYSKARPLQYPLSSSSFKDSGAHHSTQHTVYCLWTDSQAAPARRRRRQVSRAVRWQPAVSQYYSRFSVRPAGDGISPPWALWSGGFGVAYSSAQWKGMEWMRQECQASLRRRHSVNQNVSGPNAASHFSSASNGFKSVNA